MDKNSIKKNVIPYVVLLGVILILVYFSSFTGKVNKFTYNEFLQQVSDGKVRSIEVTPSNSGGVYYISGKLDGYSNKETFEVVVPLSDEVVKEIVDGYTKYDYKIEVNKDPSSSALLSIVVNFLPIVLIVAFGIYIFSKQSGGANKSFDFGKSRAKLSDDKNKVTFANVAGLKEEKEEVRELEKLMEGKHKITRIDEDEELEK